MNNHGVVYLIYTYAHKANKKGYIYDWFKWNVLTHWGWVAYICVNDLSIIGSDDGMSPDQCQAIIWTNAGILSIGPLREHFNEVLIEIPTFSFKKMHLKVLSAKWWPFCLSLNVLNSLRPNDAMSHHRTWSTSPQVTACNLFGAKPLSQPIPTFQLGPEYISVEIEWEIETFLSRACISYCCLVHPGVRDKRRVSEIDLSQPRHETAFWWRHNGPVTSQLTDRIKWPNYPVALIWIYVHINTHNKESLTQRCRRSTNVQMCLIFLYISIWFES